MSVSCH